MTNPTTPQKGTRELDDLIENLWGRALDMTSPDFANDDDYLKAQKNYLKYCQKEFQTFLSTYTNREVIKELEAVMDNTTGDPDTQYHYIKDRIATLRKEE